jgi:predicted DNA-binding transcriptional regulator AlpA
MRDMTTYVVSLAVTLDRHLGEGQDVQVAKQWGEVAGLVVGMTSSRKDEPWLRVQGMVSTVTERPDVVQIVASATGNLAQVLREHGRLIDAWHAVEVLDEDEVRRRSERPVIPPVYSTQEFADAAGLSRQRIHQYASDRKAGKRDDFPAPILDGYWLRSEADHWASTRKTKPGPAPRASA